MSKNGSESLWELVNEWAEKAEDSKERHKWGEWQYGQAMGFEKASDQLASVLRSLEVSNK